MDSQPGFGRGHQTVSIGGTAHQLPFSKGLLATSVTAAGLSPWRAYRVAEMVESTLMRSGTTSLTAAELRDLTAEVIADEAGEEAAKAYLSRSDVGKIERPLVVLIGGTTGVGKSTVATTLASRLGVTRVIPTDAVREVMRATISEELLPVIHGSSFVLRLLAGRPADPVLGYREQVAAVWTGVRALVRRAIAEGTDVILEGAHCLPGLVARSGDLPDALVVQMVVVVSDAEVHRNHFLARAHDNRSRAAQRYLAHFDNIRILQDHITCVAREHGIPVVDNHHLDSTVAACTRLVLAAIDEVRPHRLARSHLDRPIPASQGAKDQ